MPPESPRTHYARAASARTTGATDSGNIAPLYKTEDPPMAQPNFAFEKRQRELAKRRKKEEKAKRKAEAGATEQVEETSDRTPPAEQQPTE